ncbi:MAG: T9SS type A sorting domain-containing protein [Bacteroidota bacterium]
MKSNITKIYQPEKSVQTTVGLNKTSSSNVLKNLLFGATLILMLIFTMTSKMSYGQYSIAPGQTYSQNFDSLPQTGNWSTPAFWRIVADAGGSYGDGVGYVLPYSSGNNGGTGYLPAYGSGSCPSGGTMGWNCYRDSAHQSNRCIGNRATPSTNQNFSWIVAFTNTGSTYISSLKVSYEILKFMKSQSSQQAIQLFYSLDDNTYYKADSLQFTTITANDGANTCYSTRAANPADPGVGPIVNVSGLFFPNTPIAPGTTFYLAWNYSVLAINTTSKEALIALDSVYVTAFNNPPSMCCSNVTNVTNTSATLGATVVNFNAASISSRGFVYSTSSPVTISNNLTPEGGNSAGAFTKSITSFSPQTHYYYAGYAYNNINDSLSPQGNFYTLSNPPTSAASSFAATPFSGSEIDLSWNASSFPGSGANNTGYLILVRSDLTNPSTTGITNATAPGSLTLPAGTSLLATITSGNTVTYSHTGLPGLSQYNYSIVPFTWDGANAATYNYYTSGAPTSNATTTNGTPALTSPSVSNITNTSATLGATVTNNGGFALSDRGTVYNTTSSVTISTNPLSDGGLSVAPFTSGRTGLSPQTKYWFAGYATNSAGSGLSLVGTFYTISNPPTAQASNLTTLVVTGTTNDSVKWTAATFPSTGATSKGYVLLIAQYPNTPVLASTNGQAPTAGANTSIVSSTISKDSVKYFDNSPKTGLTVYNYKLIPFTWDGTNAATYNYLTTSAPTGSVRTSAGNLYTNSIGTWNFTNPIWAANSAGPFNLNWVDSNYVVFTGTAFDSLTVGANVKTQGISFLETSGSEFRICGPDTITMLGTTPTITLNGTVTANGVLDAAMKTSNPLIVAYTGTAGNAIMDFDYPNQVFTGGIIINNGIGRVNINSTNAAGTGPIVVNANAIRFTNHNGNNFPNDVHYPYNDNSGFDTIVIPNKIILDSIGIHNFSLSMGATNNPALAYTSWTGVIRTPSNFNFNNTDTIFLGNSPGILTGGGAGHAQFSAPSAIVGGIICNNSSVSATFTNGCNNAFSATSNYLFAPASGAWDFNGYNQTLASLAGPTTSGGISNSQSTPSTLTINGSATATYGGSLSGNIGITLASTNTGTFTMNGFCSQTGNTVVSGGTLVLKTTPRNTLFYQSNLTVNGGSLKDSTQQEIGNVTLSSGTLLIASGDTLYVDSTFDFTGGTLTVNGVLQINPSGTMKCHNNTIAGSGKFILTNGATLEMANTVGITSSGATGNVQVTGGRIFSTGGNYIYDGSSAQVTGNGLPATVNGLKISNASGITITNSVQVNGTLAFTAGTVTTGSNNVTIGSAGQVTGAGSSSFVNGNEIKNLASGSTAVNFEIGNGNNYTPVNLNFNGSGITSANGSLLAYTTNGNHSQIGTSMITSLQTAARFWTLTPTNLTFNTNYNATFNFVSSDLEPAAVPSSFIGSEYNTGVWNQPSVGTRTGLSTQLTGISSFSDFQVGNQCTMPSLIPTVTNVTCFSGSNGAITLSSTGGTSPFFYSWSNGSTNINISSLSAGSYTLTVTGNGSCTGTFTYSVTQPALVIPNITGGNAFCAGGALTLNAGSYSSYSWSTSATSQTIIISSAGTYSVTVTNGSGCVGTATLNVIQNALPTPSITPSGSTIFCLPNSITLSTGNYSVYSWSNGSTATSISINTSGNYSVTVTDNNGCTGISSPVTITAVSPITSLAVSGYLNTCPGGSTNLTASGAASYSWYPSTGLNTTSGAVVTCHLPSSSPITYTITGANFCGSSTTNVTVSVSAPTFTSTYTNLVCRTDSSGTITVNAIGGNTPYNYRFTNTLDNTYVSQSGNFVNHLVATRYKVQVTDITGCSSAMAYVILTQPATLTFGYATTNINCNGNYNGAITLTAAGGTPGTGSNPRYSYADNANQLSPTWIQGTSTSSAYTFASLVPNTYFVRVKDANGCTSSVMNTISITQPTGITISSQVVNSSTCSNNTGSIIIGAAGGTGVYNFAINANNSTPTYQSGYVFNNLAPGTYACRIKDANGCLSPILYVTVGCNGRLENTTTQNMTSLNVYPNPTHERATIAISSINETIATVKLINMQGKIVLSSAYDVSIGDNLIELNMADKPQGIYLVLLELNGITMKAKITVE